MDNNASPLTLTAADLSSTSSSSSSSSFYFSSITSSSSSSSSISSTTHPSIPSNSSGTLSSTSRPRIVVIVGTTGSGKTRLAIDIASACNGEIVNADSIQMYQGLDIASAKVTEEEKCSVPHHLMSFLLPHQPFTVRQYRTLARLIIDDIHRRGKLPIIVGGTMYYIQSIIREGGVLDEFEEIEGGEENNIDRTKEQTTTSIESLSTLHSTVDNNSSSVLSLSGGSSSTDLHSELKRIDPIMAGRLHPNDHRKITRALQVYRNTGIPYSTVISKQATRIEDEIGQYDTKVIWLQVKETSILDQRLNQRIETMLKKGMMEEQAALRKFLRLVNLTSSSSSSSSSLSISSTLPLSSISSAAVSSVDNSNSNNVSLLPSYPTSALASHEINAAAALLTKDTPTELTLRCYAECVKNDKNLSNIEQREDIGLLAAIGYKEFEPYWELYENNNNNSNSNQIHPDNIQDLLQRMIPLIGQKRSRKGYKIDTLFQSLQNAIEKLCDVTHRYARKQDRWIRNRFAKRGIIMSTYDTSIIASASNTPSSNSNEEIKTLSTDEKWHSFIAQPVIREVNEWLQQTVSSSSSIIPSSLSGTVSSLPPTKNPLSNTLSSSSSSSIIPSAPEMDRIREWKQYICEICDNRLLNGELDWQRHLESNTHRRTLLRKERHSRLEALGIFRKSAPSSPNAVSRSTSPEPAMKDRSIPPLSSGSDTKTE